MHERERMAILLAETDEVSWKRFDEGVRRGLRDEVDRAALAALADAYDGGRKA